MIKQWSGVAPTRRSRKIYMGTLTSFVSCFGWGPDKTFSQFLWSSVASALVTEVFLKSLVRQICTCELLDNLTGLKCRVVFRNEF